MSGKACDNYRSGKEDRGIRMVAVRIDEESANVLDEICQRKCVSRSALLRRFIRQYINENKED